MLLNTFAYGKCVYDVPLMPPYPGPPPLGH